MEAQLSGELFIVSTPIGNLGDITMRTKDVLTKVSVVLAEDTRVTGKLLHHLGIYTPMLSCHDFNEVKRFHVLENAARDNQSVALVSDAGTPLVSDPGYQMVRHAIELGMTVTPLPGPSAILAALVGSGLPCERFIFEGFLPEKAGDRRRRLDSLRAEPRTMVFYVAPSNLESTVADMSDIFGPRQACLARELTKLYEEFIRKPLPEILKHIQTNALRGEFVMVVGGADESVELKASKEVVEQRLRDLLDSGGRLKEITGVLAREVGWPSSELYKLGLAIKEAGSGEA